MMLTPALVELGGDRGQRAGPVLGGDAQPRDAAAADQVADQHVGEQMGVDIAAAQDGADLAAREALGIGEHRGEARPRRRPSTTVFSIPTSIATACSMSRSATSIDAVDASSLMIGAGQLPGSLTAMPSASVSPPMRQRAALDRAFHRRIELGLDADQLDVRLDRLGGGRDAGHQPAAADRDDQRVEVGRVRQHFERHRALPRR